MTAQRPVALVLVEHRANKNTVAVLTGAVETSAVAPRVSVTYARPPRTGILSRAAPGAQAVVVGFSFTTSGADAAAVALAELRREAASSTVPVLAIAGGAHASGDPVGTLKLGFDAAMVGEGEDALPLLLARVSAGVPPDDVPGMVRRVDGRLVRNRRPAPVDLDRFPPFAPGYNRNAPFELSRGCPWACRFCQATTLGGARVRHRSHDTLVHWAAVARTGGLKDLRFMSPDAFSWGVPGGRGTDPAGIEKLLIETGRLFGRAHVFFGSFPSEARPEHVTPEIVALVRRLAANDNIVFGAQSGSERMLQAIRRGHGIDAVIRAVEVVRAAGLRPVVDFICGLPGEEEEDRVATRALMERLAGLGAQIHTHAFMPLPGTAFRHAPPRGVDPQTAALLDRLAGAGHIGRWRVQEERARRMAGLLATRKGPTVDG